MEKTVNTEKAKKEVSVKDLKAQIMRLVQENGMLREELNKAAMYTAFKRLDYLFKLMDPSYIFSSEIIDKAREEIETTMFPKVENTENNNEETEE